MYIYHEWGKLEIEVCARQGLICFSSAWVGWRRATPLLGNIRANQRQLAYLFWGDICNKPKAMQIKAVYIFLGCWLQMKAFFKERTDSLESNSRIYHMWSGPKNEWFDLVMRILRILSIMCFLNVKCMREKRRVSCWLMWRLTMVWTWKGATGRIRWGYCKFYRMIRSMGEID